MMIFKFINHDLRAMAVVCAESVEEAKTLLVAHLFELGFPNATWLDTATIVTKNPAVPGVIGSALV